MVFAVVTDTRICVKSVAKTAFSGTSSGARSSAPCSAVMTGPPLRCRLPACVVLRPRVVVGIVAHHVWRQAHVAEDPADVHRLDLPGQEPVDQRLMIDVVPVLPEDLPAGIRAEVVDPAVVGKLAVPDPPSPVTGLRRVGCG